MTIVLDGTTGITTPDITSSGSLNIDASAPDDSLVVDASGNVGIGTSSPSYKLDVVQASAGSAVRIWDNTDSSPEPTLYLQRGTNATWGADAYTDYKLMATAGTFTISGGESGVTTERMRIDSSGNLLVGKTTGSERLSVAATQEVAAFQNTGGTGNFRFLNSGASTIGYIQWSGSTTSYVTSSDYRLKDTIAPMTGALAKVALLKPCTYKWKADGSDGQGFIAHELDEVVPGCVTGEKDAVDAEGNPEYQGIDTSFLVATLTAAIQEQQVLITQQAAAIESLTARVSALEA